MRLFQISIAFFLFFVFFSVDAQHTSTIKADSFFYAANNRLKSKWNFIDSSVFKRSIKDYAEAIALKPDYWQAYRNRARIYIHQKKYDQALEDLTLAILNADKKLLPQLFEMRGMVFYDMGMYKEAIDDFTVALKDPTDKAKTYLYLARAEWKLGFKKEACKNYEEAIRLNKSLKVSNEIIICESH
jgi:tetratricopeptide (TPR) repeat protein